MKVVELFAGVGGFRIGLERVSRVFFNVVWSNQFEPSTKRAQDTSTKTSPKCLRPASLTMTCFVPVSLARIIRSPGH